MPKSLYFSLKKVLLRPALFVVALFVCLSRQVDSYGAPKDDSISPITVEEDPLLSATAQKKTPNEEQKNKIEEASKVATPPVSLPQASNHTEKTPLASPISTSETQAEPQTEKITTGKPTYAVSFNNISIIEYIKGFVAKVANKNFIYNEEELQFRLTLVSPEGTSVENIMASLTQVLRIRGFSMIEQGNNLIIYKGADPLTSSELLSDESPDNTLPDAAIVTRLFKLDTNFEADKIEGIIKPLLSPSGIVAVSKEARYIVVTDFHANVKKVYLLMRNIRHSDSSGMEMGSYHVKHGSPAALIALAQKLVRPFTAANAQPIFEIEPKTRTIFIVSAPTVVNRTIKILETLDIEEEITKPTVIVSQTITEQHPEFIPSGHESLGFFVYKLQYHKGDKIKESLLGMGKTLVDNGIAGTDLINSINSAQWIANTNSLMFAGSNESLNRIKNLLKEVDVAPKQVFLEVLVLRTTLENALEFGVDWGFKLDINTSKNSRSLYSGFSGAKTTAPSPINSENKWFTGNQKSETTTTTDADGNSIKTTSNSTKGLIGGAGKFSIGAVGNVINYKNRLLGSLTAVINAVKTDGNTNIVINPKLLAQDNTTAKLDIGSETQIETSLVFNDKNEKTTSNKEIIKYGNFLEITPLLNKDGIVTLDLRLEISDNQSNDGNYKKIFSTTNTRVHVPNDSFLVLSGQILDNKSFEKQQVPCLGGVPGLGKLFSNTSSGHRKENMMIFLKPHILETYEEAEAFTRGQRNLLKKNTSKIGVPDTLNATLKFLNLDDAPKP
ncbi:MAG: gspD [Chlamydiales bacterium]|nr:gspD [Chlamydiales bacterium]